MHKRPTIIKIIAAMLYDLLIIIALEFTLTFLLISFRQTKVIAPNTHWYQLLLIVIPIIYICISWRLGGQTIGMKAWKLRLHAKQSDTIAWQQIMLRLLLFLPAYLMSPLKLTRPQILLEKWTNTALYNT
jgi:uncharacterized RDD family membrane protein YckC